MQTGLRNYFDKSGRLGGRISVMADPWGHCDLCENKFVQRAEGLTHVIIVVDMVVDIRCPCRPRVRGETGCYRCRSFTYFANANAHIATVLHASVFEKVMMRQAIDDRFAQAMRESGVRDSADPMCGSGSTTLAHRRNCFNIWSPLLAASSLPLANDQRQNVSGE
jgi:hypothetical protein